VRIPVACPSCGKQGSVREIYAGKKVKCSACGGTVMVPPTTIRHCHFVFPAFTPAPHPGDCWSFASRGGAQSFLGECQRPNAPRVSGNKPSSEEIP
jgi:DNA-directed RNA polymerase subunit RPC12/RpoP